MARIAERKRVDGSSSWRVEWKLGGGRDGARQSLTMATEKDAVKLSVLIAKHRNQLSATEVLDLITPTRITEPRGAGETVT
ncbi:MAG TPA: hypothetical protein VGD55_12745, partial [Acidothermaceae bacterium]